MSDPQRFDEPTPDHLADTGPVQTVRIDEDNPPLPPAPRGQRGLGLFSLLAAMALTLAAAVLLLSPQQDTPTPEPPLELTQAATPIPPTNTPVVITGEEPDALPTVSGEVLAAILSTPPVDLNLGFGTVRIVREENPFTIIPERERIGMEQYTVVSGDSIYTIAERFGIKPESLAWSNDRSIVEGISPGDVINIPPADGVYQPLIGSRTLAEWAENFGIDDPYAVIDSEANDLGITIAPNTILPSGTRVFFPGGTAEQITWWTPTVIRGGGASGAANSNFISFAPGEPGSCGQVENTGGGAGWFNPLPGGYTFMRGFSSFHAGVDLAVPAGTTVNAANGGRVIFAGWSNWGYGNTVVLAHGPFTTLYGHLSAVFATCGQSVAPGTPIASSGSTGNSSGPHLHFEIRYNDIPQDPSYTIGF